MTSTAAAPKRPISLTIICVIGLMGTIALAYIAFSEGLYHLPDWYPPYLFLAAGIGLTALTGMFLMRRWGFYLYLALFVMNQVILISTGLWSMGPVIGSLIVLFVGVSHLKDMR